MKDLEHSGLKSYYDDIMELVAQKEPPPTSDAVRAPVPECIDRDEWEREVDPYRMVPTLLAFSSEVSPGSYWATTHVGVPVILTRLKSGDVRLMINACRHRGAMVVSEGQGKLPRFTCIYHAWTFGLDGKLLGVADRHLFGDVDRDCYGLTQLAVEERGGLIWGMLKPGLSLDLDTFFGIKINDFSLCSTTE